MAADPHIQAIRFESVYPEISHLGSWTASSYKVGFGTECLRDDDIETFWHSDGPQPHTLTVQFPQKTPIQQVALLLAYQLDDSYTPAQLCIRAGTGVTDMQDVRMMAYDKPAGWVTVDLTTEPVEDGEGFKPLHAYVVQVIVLNNHMNGKDSHIRGMKILGPKDEYGDDGDPFPFTEPQFRTYMTIR